MAYTYAAFEEQTTDALRLAMLRQHISEVRAQMGPDVGAGGKYKNSGGLTDYLRQLNDRRKELEGVVPGSATARGVSYADFRGAGAGS